jgi:O-acetyl-ADP-ribose deacetylase (regulator of RNase III)
MLYPAQAVDGVVTLLGGSELRAQLQAVPCNGLKDEAGQPLRCQIGDSVITSGRCGQLPFDLVAHAVPPFWSDGNWERALCSAYASSLEGLVGRSGTAAELWIASPLLGSGARGAPSKQAAEAATSELVAWLVDAELPLRRAAGRRASSPPDRLRRHRSRGGRKLARGCARGVVTVQLRALLEYSLSQKTRMVFRLPRP